MKAAEQAAVIAQFARNLAEARRRAGLSQEALGRRASLHRTEVSLLERATRMPRLDTVVKLAGALSISPCELLGGIAWTPGKVTPGGFQVSGRISPSKD